MYFVNGFTKMSTVLSDIWIMAMYIVHCTESPLKINVDYEILFIFLIKVDKIGHFL